jgi:hypothetical protein
MLKKHYLAILLSIVIALLTFCPQFLSINSMEDSWQGVYPINTADDIYYLARAQDSLDGHIFLSNPYLYEHKDSSPMQFWLADYFLAMPANFFNINVAEVYAFYDLFLVIILVLLTYSILYNLSKNKLLSLSSTTFLHLALFLDRFGRSPSPQFNFIFWLLLTLFLIKYIKTNKKIYIILSGLSFGLLFHLYTYYWTFWLCLLGILFLVNIFLKEKKIKEYFYVILIGILIGIPYFITMFQSLKLPFYNESIYRLGMIDTHFPSGFKIVSSAILILFIYFVLWKKKVVKNDALTRLLLIGTVSTVICVNQHLITGKNLEFSSHYLVLSVFWFIFFFTYLFNKILQNKKDPKRIVTILFILILSFSFLNIKNKFLSDIKAKNYEINWQRYVKILNWLNDNTNLDSIVYADSEMSNLIPVYTHNNIYYNRFANLFFISNKECQERFIINNYWDEFTDEYILDYQRYIWGVHYIDEYGHNQSKNKIKKILGLEINENEIIPRVKKKSFKKLSDEIKSKSIEESLFSYKVDYLIWDKTKNPHWLIEDLKFLEKVFEFNDIIVYKII